MELGAVEVGHLDLSLPDGAVLGFWVAMVEVTFPIHESEKSQS